MSVPNDEYICKLLRHNDVGGMELLYGKYYRPMVLWANTFLNNLPAAEDVVQDFFVAFWERESFNHLRSSNLKGYLFAAVKFAAIKHIDKHDPLRKTSEVGNLAVELIELDDLTEEMLRQIEAEIEKLPARTRQILKAVYFEGLRYKEVAVRFGISLETVKTLLSNAMKRLRAIFGALRQ